MVESVDSKSKMFWGDIRGHHGHKWNYEPGDYYMGRNKNKVGSN